MRMKYICLLLIPQLASVNALGELLGNSPHDIVPGTNITTEAAHVATEIAREHGLVTPSYVNKDALTIAARIALGNGGEGDSGSIFKSAEERDRYYAEHEERKKRDAEAARVKREKAAERWKWMRRLMGMTDDGPHSTPTAK